MAVKAFSVVALVNGMYFILSRPKLGMGTPIV
jgi:hypothetical protein